MLEVIGLVCVFIFAVYLSAFSYVVLIMAFGLCGGFLEKLFAIIVLLVALSFWWWFFSILPFQIVIKY
jgi:hypothetical protein